MNRSKRFLVAALIAVSASAAQADIVIYELDTRAAQTAHDLGRDLIMACAFLAAGRVAAAFIAGKK